MAVKAVRWGLGLFLLCQAWSIGLAAGSVVKRDTVWVVRLNPAAVKESDCHLSLHDGLRKVILIGPQDTLQRLDKFVETEPPVLEAPCFLPTLKIIFRHYTYVLSPYCGIIVKLRNDTPFKPSAYRLANDFIFTESLVEYFNNLEQGYFHQNHDEFFKNVAKTTPSAVRLYGGETDAFESSFDTETDPNVELEDVIDKTEADTVAALPSAKKEEAELETIEEIMERAPDEEEAPLEENETDIEEKQQDDEDNSATQPDLDFDDFDEPPKEPKDKRGNNPPPKPKPRVP